MIGGRASGFLTDIGPDAGAVYTVLRAFRLISVVTWIALGLSLIYFLFDSNMLTSKLCLGLVGLLAVVITLTFLPHQIENFNAVIDMMPSSDMVGLAPLSDYQRFIDALIKWGRYKNVRNVGTALALLADIALVELAEAAEAAEAEEEDAKSVG